MVTPLKSPLDVYGYRYIILSNGLRALLVTSCDYGEPSRKKVAYTKCQHGDNPSHKRSCANDKTKEFDKKNTVGYDDGEEDVLQHGVSLLDNIVRLSKTNLNLLNGDRKDVPTEHWPESNDYPELTEKQQKAACRATQNYDMLACVGVCVSAGFFDDPVDLEGAAHLVEHTMFMGCQAYPKGKHFDDFLTYTGGSSWNGSTDGHRTVYYFDTSTDYLAETFDIVAEHFKNPLFSIESIVRERENVDSEFKQALPVHLFRFHHFIQTLATPGHPYARFSWGNAKTLSLKKSDEQIQKILKEFYEKFYSADSMFLTVQAALSLNDLEDLVRDAFESIPTRKVDRVPMDTIPMPFCNDRFTKLYRVVATTKIRLLAVTWQLPPESWKMYNVKPLEYIEYILLNENVNGLPHYLRERSLITQVIVNPLETNLERSDVCAIFSIHFHLTKYGLENYELILEALFSFIQMIIRTGPQFHIFSELSRLKSITFHYLGENDIGLKIKELSEAMRIYAPEDVICGPHLIRKFDKELISRMTSLLKPDCANYILLAKEFHSLKKLSTEKHFGINFEESNFPCNLMERLKSIKPRKEFWFCKCNPFITTNFCLVQPDSEEDVETLIPTQILDPNYPPDRQPVNLWFLQDDNFIVPQASYSMTISSPYITGESPYNAVMLDIFVALYENLFKGYTFSATAALLDHSVETTSRGLYFRWAGFNDKLPLLFSKTLDQLVCIEQQTDERRFNEIHFQVKEEYENNMLEPRILSSDIKQTIVTEQYWSLQSRYKVCTEDEINLSRFKVFVENFKKRLHIRLYVDGNISRAIARQLMKLVTDKLKYEPVSMDEYPKNRAKLLPIGERCIRVQSYNFDGDTSVIKGYFQIGLATPYNRVISEYILERIGEPLFNTLRTEKQISYDPQIVDRKIFGVLAIQVYLITSSNKQDPDHVDREIDNFFENYYDLEISTLTEAKFKYIRNMSIESKLTDIQAMDCEAEWEKIVQENVKFSYLVEDLNVWRKLTAKDIKTFFKKYLLRPCYVQRWYPEFFKENKCIEYRKLSIQVIGYKEEQKRALKSKHPVFSVLNVLKESRQARDEEYFIDNLDKFKAHLYSFPPCF